MKILLMTPTVNDNERRPSVIGISNSKLLTKIKDKLGFAPGVTPSYGLLYISSSLKKANHQTFYIDGNIDTIQSILDLVESESVDAIGISVLSFNWERAKSNIRIIKERFPNIIILVGGVHVSYFLEEILIEFPLIDYILYGEGEDTIVRLLDCIQDNKDISIVNGIIYKHGDSIKKTPPPLSLDLDSLPYPDLDVLGKELYKYRPAPMFYKNLPHASIFASRGCPFRCVFCLSNPRLRKRDPYKIVDEIELYVKKYKIKSITFYDETLTLDKKWIKTICNEIIQRKINIAWSGNVRADTVDGETLKLMHESGCWQLLFGIESGVQKNLDRIAKGISLVQVRNAVRLVKQTGIETLGMFMFGIPGETYEEGLDTIRFACSLDLDYAIFTNITPFPGTVLYDQVKNETGFKGLKNLTPLKLNYIPDSMTEEQLAKLLKEAYHQFYFRRSLIIRQILSIRNFEDIEKNLKGFIQLWN